MKIKQSIKTELLTFDYIVTVSREGIFHTVLPDDIVKKLKAVGIDIARRPRHPYKEGYYQDNNMNDLACKIQEVVKQYSKKEFLGEKIIIKYKINTRCAYCKTESGEIVPNGSWLTRIDKVDWDAACKWLGGTVEMNASNREEYGFNVIFEIRLKKTWRFPNGKEFDDYLRLNDNDDKIQEGSTLDWLNSICSMTNLRYGDDVKEIEYSEEAGLFFKNMILYIIKINEKLKEILGKDISLKDISKIKMIDFLKNQTNK